MTDWLEDETLRVALDRGVLLFALITARIAPIVELAPFLGGKAALRTVKTAVALALTVLLFPVLWSPQLVTTPLTAPQFALLVAKETLVGLTLGFVTALVFESVRMAGQIIDAARGQTMANAMVPQLPERVSVSGDFLYMLAVPLFFLVGGHRLFLAALADSYVTIPLLVGPTFASGGGVDLALLFIRLTADAVTLAVSFAFPVIASVLLADLVLALVNRSAPQVNVFFLGMPLKAALGTAVMLLGLGVFADEFQQNAVEGMGALADVVHLLSGG